MDKYTVSIEVTAEVRAFDETDARDYVSDIFGVDDEIKDVKIVRIEKN
jgi:hypothetical protein